MQSKSKLRPGLIAAIFRIALVIVLSASMIAPSLLAEWPSVPEIPLTTLSMPPSAVP